MITKLLPCVLLAVLAAPGTAQDGHKKDTQAIPAAAKSAKAAKLEFSLPVTGLTEDRTDAVETTLAGMTGKYYECTECGHVEAMPGECKGCETDLKEMSGPVFKKTVADAKKGTLTFHLAKGREIRLSQIENALEGEEVEIQRAKLALEPQALLVFEGGANKEDASALQSALRAAKLADAVAFFAPQTKEIHVRLHEGSATWAKVAKVGSELAKPLRLEDVIFGASVGKAVKAS